MSCEYVCTGCLRRINRLFALPPVQADTKCGHCGQPIRRSVGSFQQAWTMFVCVWTFLIFVGAFCAQNHVRNGAEVPFLSVVLAGMFFAFLACIPAGMIGCGIGTVVGKLMGAADGSRRVGLADIYRVAADEADAAVAPKLVPGLMIAPAAMPAVKSLRCWHCGHTFDVATDRGEVKVRCPSCDRGLGSVRGSD